MNVKQAKPRWNHPATNEKGEMNGFWKNQKLANILSNSFSVSSFILYLKLENNWSERARRSQRKALGPNSYKKPVVPGVEPWPLKARRPATLVVGS